nr:zinc finger protein 1 [Hymenolepis microstoma]
MGLCKCERKKVTNLFCFEHRVNVCEFCLLSNHPKVNRKCPLCNKELDNGEECVRLMCLDLFHWNCLDNYASELPPKTAPAGYECPSCSMVIIPLRNQGGPIAEALRQKLTSAKWVKPNYHTKISAPKNKSKPLLNANDTLNVFGDSKLLDSSLDTYASQFLSDQQMVNPPTISLSKPTETIVSIEYPINNVSISPTASRVESKSLPLFNLSNPRNLIADDDDTDKYKRHHTPVTKSNSSLLGFTRMSFLIPKSLFRRRLSFIFGLIIFICFLLIFIANMLAGQSLPEDNLQQARGHLPVGI